MDFEKPLFHTEIFNSKAFNTVQQSLTIEKAKEIFQPKPTLTRETIPVVEDIPMLETDAVGQ